MKIKFFFSLLFGFLPFSDMMAQEVYLVVYEGEVFMDNRSLNKGHRYTFPVSSSVKITKDSKTIFFTKSKLVTVQPTTEKKLSQRNVLALINREPNKIDLIDYIFRLYKITKIEEASKGKTIAGVSGWNKSDYDDSGADSDRFFPMDSAKIIGKDISLKWNFKSKIIGAKIYFIHKASKDTLYNSSISEKGFAKISVLKEGEYEWVIISKIEKRTPLRRALFKLSSFDEKKIIDDFNEFKKQISVFDQTIQDNIIEKYLFSRNVTFDSNF